MTRTILQIVQDAAPRVGLEAPSVLFSSTDQQDIELAKLVNECVERIVRVHDWSLLTTTETNTGDGSTAAFALPSDYIRMPKDAQVWSTRWQRPLIAVSPEDALRLSIRNYDLVTGAWYIEGGNINFTPALASGEDAKWKYISNAVIAPNSGSNKARATADDDTFRLDDRMLELAVIWSWRQHKGLPYAEHMVTAEEALAQQIGQDRGARILTQASRHNIRAQVSYPWEIT